MSEEELSNATRKNSKSPIMGDQYASPQKIAEKKRKRTLVSPLGATLSLETRAQDSDILGTSNQTDCSSSFLKGRHTERILSLLEQFN